MTLSFFFSVFIAVIHTSMTFCRNHRSFQTDKLFLLFLCLNHSPYTSVPPCYHVPCTWKNSGLLITVDSKAHLILRPPDAIAAFSLLCPPQLEGRCQGSGAAPVHRAQDTAGPQETVVEWVIYWGSQVMGQVVFPFTLGVAHWGMELWSCYPCVYATVDAELLLRGRTCGPAVNGVDRWQPPTVEDSVPPQLLSCPALLRLVPANDCKTLY